MFRCNSPHLNELIICPIWLVSFLLLFFIIEMLCLFSLFYFPGLNQVLLSPSFGQGVIFDGGEQDCHVCKDSSNNHPISVDNGSIHTWLSRIPWSLRALTAFKDRMNPSIGIHTTFKSIIFQSNNIETCQRHILCNSFTFISLLFRIFVYTNCNTHTFHDMMNLSKRPHQSPGKFQLCSFRGLETCLPACPEPQKTQTNGGKSLEWWEQWGIWYFQLE